VDVLPDPDQRPQRGGERQSPERRTPQRRADADRRLAARRDGRGRRRAVNLQTTVISASAPCRSIQRPTGKAANAETTSASEKAPVTSARDHPSSVCIGTSTTE
jgi:hypothetical protein